MITFGEVCELLADGGKLGNWRFDKVANCFRTAIFYNQCLEFRSQGKLVGVLTYALVSDEVLAALLRGDRRITFEDWQSGENLFFADFVAPFGGVAQMMRQTQKLIEQKKGKGAIGYWYRPKTEKVGYAKT